MSIILTALALAAAPAPNPALGATVDHSQHQAAGQQHQDHAKHMEEMHKHCQEMMKHHGKMNHGAKPGATSAPAAGGHAGHHGN